MPVIEEQEVAGQETRGKRRIRVFDTTLRDGEQTPGVSFTAEDKVEIAKALDRLGVDVIEAGFPIVSEGEMRAFKLIKRLGLEAEVCGLSRADRKDIDALNVCGVDYAHIFIATSDLHLQYKLKMTKEQVVSTMVDAVEYARSQGMKVLFSAEDATRSDRGYLVSVLREAKRAGASMMNIPDTVGTATPWSFGELVSEVKRSVDVPLSVHCHDDYGMAVANSLAGIAAGAVEGQFTMNGLGERAGNASLEEFAMAAKRLFDYDLKLDSKLLYETSRVVARTSKVLVQPNKAIIGENAFGHESGIHTHGVLSLPATYEPMDPELVGARRRIQAGKHAGTHGIHAQLKQLDINPNPEQTKEILRRVKELGDRGKPVTDVDLDKIAREVVGSEKRPAHVRLADVTVVTGKNAMPTASVKLLIGESREVIVADSGVGPVDAALRAIQKITDQFGRVELREYRLDAITGGSNAEAEVFIKAEDELGNFCSASATGHDVVMASVEAMVSAINEIVLRRPQQQQPANVLGQSRALSQVTAAAASSISDAEKA